MKITKTAALLVVATCLPAVQQAAAQDYPSRPIRLIVPWSAGGIADLIARGLAASLSESFKQQVVVDDRPGGGGTLGIAIVAKSLPDGYTLMMTDVPSHAISATLYKTLPYDPLKDIEPIALPSRSAMVLVVNPKLGVNSVARLIEYAKAHPGQLAFASSGNGAITHLTGERFKRDAGVNILHVTYKGGIPQGTAIVAGEVGMGFVCSAAALSHVKGGRLTALGVTLLKRSPQFPDVPTMAESIPGFEMGCNTGFFAPGATPRAIINRLHAEAMKAVQQPKLQELLATNLAEPAPFTQAQFKEHVAKEVRDWGEVVRAAGLTID